MIETTNLTNTAYDLERYRDADDVRAFLRTFSLDGLEVMPWGENTLSFLPPDAVPGLHLGYFPCWVDFYRGQEEPVLREFGSMQAGVRPLRAAKRRKRSSSSSADRWISPNRFM